MIQFTVSVGVNSVTLTFQDGFEVISDLGPVRLQRILTKVLEERHKNHHRAGALELAKNIEKLDVVDRNFLASEIVKRKK
jgi:hypothetical protein